MGTAATNASSPVLPSIVDTLRSMADAHSAIANQYEKLADAHHTRSNELEELANRQVRIETDPGFAQRIREAEDQVVGDELLMEAQTPQDRGGAEDGTSTLPRKDRVVVHRGSGVNPPPSTPPPTTNMRI